MRYQTFVEHLPQQFPVALLAPKLEVDGITREYLDPHTLDPNDLIAYQLHITGKTTPAVEQKGFLDDLLPVLQDMGSEYILVTDSAYFKTLTGVNKAEPYLGYVLPNTYPVSMANQFNVIFVPNYRQVFYDPQRTKDKITQALDALFSHRNDHYQEPGNSIIHFEAYPDTLTEIAAWLQKLMAYPALTADIEAFSLRHYDAGIGSISFAWNQHEGIAFAVDLGTDPVAIRRMLLKFFKEYKGNIKWHNGSYDLTVLVYQLFMNHLLDYEGLLEGLSIMLDRDWDDTKLVAYFATNSCAGNKLSLKDLAQEYAGNYAQSDIDDITKIPLPELLRYNLVDSLSTWYVWNKHWDTLVADDQLDPYRGLFMPAVTDIVQMQLTDMPVDRTKVAVARETLEEALADAVRRIQNKPIVKAFTYEMDMEHVATRNAALKTKQIKMGDEPQEFNPNSGPQLIRLLYEEIGLPVIERTDTKLPATGGNVLEKLKVETEELEVLDLLDALIDFKKVDKILNSFIPALEGSVQGPDGWYYLFGSFNLGGTISGRLSSSKPNLQNLPANSKFGKVIKDCFVGPDGQLFIGLDFASLEDRISALTTRDPNKLAVYTDGFDGHCLRAQSYFAEEMPDIERALEGARCYEATINGKQVFFHEHETITYLGQIMTGGELWDRLSNVQTAA